MQRFHTPPRSGSTPLGTTKYTMYTLFYVLSIAICLPIYILYARKADDIEVATY